MKKVLVVSPHMDDETLGAGGTIIRHIEEGDKVFWLNICSVKEEYGYSSTKVNGKKNTINLVSKNYSFAGYKDLEMEPAKLADCSESILMNNIKEYVEIVEPEVVYLPFYNDAHTDHYHVFKAFQPLLKSFRYPYIKEAYMMEIVSETNFALPNNIFSPNYFVNISNQFKAKLEIVSIYKNELGEHPFPRSLNSVEALATLRGAYAGVKYAEAFEIIKYIK